MQKLTLCLWLYKEVSPLNLFDAKYACGEKRSNARGDSHTTSGHLPPNCLIEAHLSTIEMI